MSNKRMSSGQAVPFNQVGSYCCYLSNKQTDSLYVKEIEFLCQITNENDTWIFHYDPSSSEIKIKIIWYMKYIMMNT